MTLPYRGSPVTIRTPVFIPRCDTCGALAASGRDAEALERACAAARRSADTERR